MTDNYPGPSTNKPESKGSRAKLIWKRCLIGLCGLVALLATKLVLTFPPLSNW